ncbi:DUF616 domain-containing protein [Coraliomargarita sp. SDUM461003]|uniref:DUF616 domain-containing protein n=1 Tax=Thalassobacterium maritimum TaxID=3041265 RepID=A0ABU1AZH7_9BACT|nr:glycosyltransferase domain-containing protein [Coraliomargarita sp. SDUM461003]MDQ8208550.1 DUF616 domain-containing protein [Coraliomargarita sp. SDUM461003]
MLKIAIYTAIVDAYDAACHLGEDGPIDGIDFFCFSDRSIQLPTAVSFKPLTRTHKDPTRDARNIKINGYRQFNDYDWVIWVDANCKINAKAIRAHLLACTTASAPIHVFSHDVRDCLFDEAQWAFSQAVDSPAIVSAQVNRYFKEGMPKKFGLANTNLLARQPRQASVHAFSDTWWHELSRGSRRDQLSFDYVRWKQSTRVDYFPGLWFNSKFCVRVGEHARPTKAASFNMIMLTEWCRRVVKANNLFREVLYQD